MFFEEGWVPLAEATSEVFRRLQGFVATDKMVAPKAGLSEVLAISVWDICDACTKIGVTGNDGIVVPASKDLVAWADPRNLSNEHLNLRAGNVGSSELTDDAGEAVSQATMITRYGPFFGLPVVIPINNFQSSLTFLEEEVTGQPDRDDMVVEAAKVILTMRKTGDFLTREIARVKLGASLSRRKFKMAWALAAQHAPDLAEPNRWNGL